MTAFVRACLLPLLLAAACCSRRSTPPALPASHAVYAWNYDWTPAVSNAVRRAVAGGMARIYPVCGELGGRGGVGIDAPALAAAGAPVVPVVRVLTREARRLESAPGDLAADLHALLRPVVHRLRAAGAPVDEIQLDLDCPERLLRAYAGFLPGFRAGLPGLRVSLTVLPCHAGNRGLRAVAAACDELVLQVHGTSFPSRADQPVQLLDADEARTAIRRVSALGAPFRVALPNYALTLVHDAASFQLKGLRFADDPDPVPGEFLRVAAPDPAKVQEVMGVAGAAPGCLGVVWFRLPVSGDAMAWDMESWLSVTRGNPLRPRVEAALVPHTDGSLRLVLTNHADLHSRQGEVALDWSCPDGDFGVYHPGDFCFPGTLPRLIPCQVPRPGESAEIAWFRTRQTPLPTPRFLPDP